MGSEDGLEGHIAKHLQRIDARSTHGYESSLRCSRPPTPSPRINAANQQATRIKASELPPRLRLPDHLVPRPRQPDLSPEHLPLDPVEGEVDDVFDRRVEERWEEGDDC